MNSPGAAQQYAPPVAQPQPTAAGQALVQVIDGNDKGLQATVTPTSPVTLGRAPACSITLNDPGVSGQHASISFEATTLVVTDTGSRNGVFVNNQKISRQQLASGDLIVVGSTRLLVSL